MGDVALLVSLIFMDLNAINAHNTIQYLLGDVALLVGLIVADARQANIGITTNVTDAERDNIGITTDVSHARQANIGITTDVSHARRSLIGIRPVIDVDVLTLAMYGTLKIISVYVPQEQHTRMDRGILILYLKESLADHVYALTLTDGKPALCIII